MKIHDVCALCAKTCKQPFAEWDDSQLETKFCIYFRSVKIESKLPFEKLQELMGVIALEEENGLDKSFYEFLKELEKVYIPCIRCSRMIAPDELYNIMDDGAVCQQCFEEENSP